LAARVFQVAYDQGLLTVREWALSRYGLSVTSAFGNAEARRLLAENAPFDVFVVGWSTTFQERKAIVSWLKQRWPAIPVVAIHDSFQTPIPGADVTTTHDTPEEWIAAVRAATRSSGGNGGSA
jgi:DNA-binding NtrC family response regulator